MSADASRGWTWRGNGRPRIGLTLLAFITCLPAIAEQGPGSFSRALPLNTFSDSRRANTDAQGFYFLPTAIGDDYFDGTSSIQRVSRHFRTARQAGAKYLRCAFSWNGIEKEQGTYNWAFWDMLVRESEKHRIRLIPYVAYTPEWAARAEKEFWKQPPRSPELYAEFMNRIAARYRGRVAAWEIWNEPDNKDYWTGTTSEFASLVTLAARRIRDADPQAVLVLGGMAYGPSEFFRTLMTEHRIDRHVDVIALHAYPESWLNERAETVFEEWIPAMQQMISENRSGAELWLNEMGYADYRFTRKAASVYGTNVFYDYEHTRRYQAVMLFKFHVMALASQQVSLTGWYRIDDFPHTERRLGSDFVNFHLGVVDSRRAPKPALAAMKFFNHLFRSPALLVRTHQSQSANSAQVVQVFRTKDGRIVVVGWLRSSQAEEVEDESGMARDERAEVVSTELPCASPGAVAYYSAQGQRLRSTARVGWGALENVRLRGDRVFVAEVRCGETSGQKR